MAEDLVRLDDPSLAGCPSVRSFTHRRPTRVSRGGCHAGGRRQREGGSKLKLPLWRHRATRPHSGDRGGGALATALEGKIPRVAGTRRRKVPPGRGTAWAGAPRERSVKAKCGIARRWAEAQEGEQVTRRTEQSPLPAPAPHLRGGETGAWAGHMNSPRTHNGVVTKNSGFSTFSTTVFYQDHRGKSCR